MTDSQSCKPTESQRIAYRAVRLMVDATSFPMMADIGMSVYDREQTARWGQMLREAFDAHWMKTEVTQ